VELETRFAISAKIRISGTSLRKKLLILAENSELNDLEGLQRTLLDAFSSAIDYY
jgi:hypothetical protein